MNWQNRWSLAGFLMHGLFVLVVSELFAWRIYQLFQNWLSLLEVRSCYHSESILVHVKHVSDLECWPADVMWVVLRTVETQCVRLSGSTHFRPIRYIYWLSLPVAWYRIELHELHYILAHRVIGFLLVCVPQKVQDHAEQQKWTNTPSIRFGHVSDLQHCFEHKYHRLKLRIKFLHFVYMFDLIQAIALVDRNVKWYLGVDMDELDKRYFWIPDVLDVTK